MPFNRRGIFRTAGHPRGDRGRIISAAGGGDPFFGNVVLLLDFDEVDGATDITDLSGSAHVDDNWAVTAQIDDQYPYLGLNNLLLDGDSDWISFADHADWDLGTGDFTLEISCWYSITTGSQIMMSTYDASAPHGWSIQTSAGPVLNFNGGGAQLKSETWAPSGGTWYHIAVCRSGTNLRIFVDGTQLGSPTTDSTDITGDQKLHLGVLRNPSPTQYFDGRLAAVRITKGVARYTENFTAPAEFYPTS